MNRSDKIDAIASALFDIQNTIKPIAKNAENPYYGSKYADLETVWDGIREGLQKAGIVVIQTNDSQEGKDMVLVTTLYHCPSSQWIESRLSMPLSAQSPQQVGSSITYARRYALTTAFNLITEDDDANASTKPPVQGKAAPAATWEPSATPQHAEPVANGNFQPMIPVEVQKKDGTSKAGKPYTSYFVKFQSGITASTFDADTAKFLHEKINTSCGVVLEQNGKYWNIKSVDGSGLPF